MQQLPEAFAALNNYPQFILYKLVPSENKIDKLPVDYRTGKVFTKEQDWQNDPSTQTDFNTALEASKKFNLPIGYFFTKNDPFFFLDIDNCLTTEKTWSSTAVTIMNQLPGAAIEISQSGNGLHIFASGDAPEHGCKNKDLGLEFYTESRFCALTGFNTVGNAATDLTNILPSIISTYFPPKISARGVEWTNVPLPEWTSPGDNDALIKKALSTSSMAAKFGKRASFRDLWENNIEVLSYIYPSRSGSFAYDQSDADMALAQHLAFWTGCNCEHILQLMWCSGLVRDKWTYHPTYLENFTISNAVSLQEVVYTAGKRKEPERIPTESKIHEQSLDIEIVEGYQFLPATRQIEHFKNCVYIQDIHSVLIPSGMLLKSEQFNATYGGYVFQLDGEASGKTTTKAWDAFTQSQVIRYPKAETTCFRPWLKPVELIKKEGRILVNTYIPVETKRVVGDITPFLNHLNKMLPDQRDRAILLAYMAACIQHKGCKFQWAPLLQGVQGNGKTLFTRCVAYAIGERYTHMPFANEISEKYNDWLFDKLFIGVEDVYVPEHKAEIIEILKPMITNNRLAMRAMRSGQIMGDVYANFMLNSNHKNAIKIMVGDRRFAIFFTAQQTIDDLIHDGMGGDYFPKLYNWLRDESGYAMVNEYLSTYVIPVELNPALEVGGLAQRAPMTTSTTEAIWASMGGVEQEIIEAIESGRMGFSNGWISSMAVERLLQQLHAIRRIPPNKRREMLQSLGYDWHPGLRNGRVTTQIPEDGGKPKLFIKIGHISSNLSTQAEIIKAYQDAQRNSVPFGTNNLANKLSQY